MRDDIGEEELAWVWNGFCKSLKDLGSIFVGWETMKKSYARK